MIDISKMACILPVVVLCFCAVPAEAQVLVAGGAAPEMSEEAVAVSAPGAAILPEGTPVVLAFTASLSSKTAVKGAPVNLVLVNDISVGGVTVAKAGCKAFGQVTDVMAAAIPGRSGALNLQIDYLEVGDKQVRLRASKERSGESGVRYGHPYRLKWPMGLFRTGDDVEIKQGTVLAVFIAEDMSL